MRPGSTAQHWCACYCPASAVCFGVRPSLTVRVNELVHAYAPRLPSAAKKESKAHSGMVRAVKLCGRPRNTIATAQRETSRMAQAIPLISDSLQRLQRLTRVWACNSPMHATTQCMQQPNARSF